MSALLITAIVVAFVFLYIAIFRLIKKTRFYRNLEVLYEQALKVPSKVKTKGDVRRIKKYRPYLRMFRRKMLSLIIVNIVIFMATYTGMLILITAIVSKFSIYFIESPVSIPLFSVYDETHGKIHVYVYSLVLLALATVSYPISKEMKLQRSLQA